MDIQDKKVIITGGARGMGKQFAIDLQRLGATPYVVDIVNDNLIEMKRETGIPGEILDVSIESDVENFFAEYTAKHGAPDILINNAGITADGMFLRKKGNEISKFSLTNWQKVIDVNLTGVFLCAREAAFHMVEKEVKGLIINISSLCRVGNIGQTNYAASKAGIDAMTVTWAKELSRFGIRTAAIAPGYVNTEMVAQIREDIITKVIKNIPVGRLGEMEDLSQALQFIISNDFYSGRVLEIDGGMRL